jgi:hypothetical protein
MRNNNGITDGVISSLRLPGSDQSATATVRRDLMRRVGALDVIADTVRGEAPELRVNSKPLQAAMDGLFIALSGWSAVANHLATIPDPESVRESTAILQALPVELRTTPIESGTANRANEPARVHRLLATAVRTLVALPATEPSLWLLADRMAQALPGIGRAIDVLVLLHEPGSAVPHSVAGNILICFSKTRMDRVLPVRLLVGMR